MIRCLTCDVTLAVNADSSQHGKCPTCGSWLQITCRTCGNVSSAHTVVASLFRCPHCKAKLAVPGPSIAGLPATRKATGIVWVLLPDDMVGYVTFVGAYAVATVIGLASSVPAGAGVFESSILTLLHSRDAAALAAAFLGYRLAYFLLPLAIASAALAADSFIHRRQR